MIDKKTGIIIDVAAFISQDGGIILIDTPESKDIGEYEIRVCSTIFNSLLTKECSQFDLVIVPVAEGKIFSVEPEFLLALQD